MRSFGLKGLQEQLRKHIRLNEFFAATIDQSDNFELILPPFLNYSCFRYHPPAVSDEAQLNALNEQLLETINRQGVIFLTHTKLQGKYVLRILFGQTYVEQEHVEKALRVIQDCATSVKPSAR